MTANSLSAYTCLQHVFQVIVAIVVDCRVLLLCILCQICCMSFVGFSLSWILVSKLFRVPKWIWMQSQIIRNICKCKWLMIPVDMMSWVLPRILMAPVQRSVSVEFSLLQSDKKTRQIWSTNLIMYVVYNVALMLATVRTSLTRAFGSAFRLTICTL